LSSDVEQLVLRAQAGGLQAFDELLCLYQAPLFRHARRMLWTDDEAYDALQQSFLTIVRKIRNLRRRDKFRAWAYGVTTRVCLKMIGRRKGGEVEADDVQLPDQAMSPDLLTETIQRREALLASVLTLSARLRSVILLHFYEELSLVEVAAALEINVGTAKSRLSAGLKKLRLIDEVKDHG
jgi:RNA polymerase sigma-70 factor, ECF subfamily